MTKPNTQPCNEFYSSMIFAIKNTIGVWPDTFKILFSETLKLLSFQMLWSRLFHLITAEGKNEFLKKLCFVLNRGMALSFLVV